MNLRPETHGVIRVIDGAVEVIAHGPNKKKERAYPVKPHLLRPSGVRPDQIDGAEATVVWDLLKDGQLVEVRVAVPEGEGPIPLAREGHFLNPYNFISLPDRAGLPEDLDVGEPVGHDRYHLDRWTGTIEVSVETRTPLLLPDHAKAAAGPEPHALPVRVGPDGRPLLAGSAIKGALRTAYEAITNSRLGVFGAHDLPLAIRARADESAAGLRPAWVSSVDPGGVTLKVVSRLNPTRRDLLPADRELKKPLLAAWVPRRLACRDGCGEAERCRKPNGRHCAEPRGKRVEAWLYLALLGKTPVWRVADYAEPGQLRARGAVSVPESVPEPVAGYPLVRVVGRLHWNGSTFPPGGDDKHDERMVVEEVLEGPAEIQIDEVTLTEEQVDAWKGVIDSYTRAREHDRRPLTDYGDYVSDPKRWRTLLPGDTLHVEVDGSKKIVGLYPAMIGRKPFPGPPRVSLPETHRPAESLKEFTPADRVFGWVRQGADRAGTAYRGHLRVLPPDGDGLPGRESVQTFPRPVPLAILGTPKPTQFRFYLGDSNGAPLHGVEKQPGAGYPARPGERRLRGRKTYLTHAEVLIGQPGAEEYWDPAGGPGRRVEVAGHQRYREYLLPPGKANPAVVTRISGWVKAGTKFRFTLHVDNLSRNELAALLWLLNLPADASLKLGLGKPLGFGAVRMSVVWEATRLYHDERLRQRYEVIGARPAAEPVEALKQMVDDYDNLLRKHLPQVRDEFLTAARGFTGTPVHYPRLTRHPEIESFRWFVENDRVSKGDQGARALALGALTDHEKLPLPYEPPSAKKAAGGKRRQDGSRPSSSSRAAGGAFKSGAQPAGNRPRQQRRKRHL